MAELPKITFKLNRDFQKSITAKVNDYFKEHNLTKYANGQMVFKTVFMFLLYFTPYALLFIGVFDSILAVIVLYAVMGLGMAGIGLSIMHDANHSSYSRNKRVNKWLSYTMNMLGASSINWKIQHNVLHHTYTNVKGVDEDITPPEALMRFSPHAKHYKIHRFQFLYSWFFYGLMTLSWTFQKDFFTLAMYNSMSLLKTQKTTYGKEVAILWTSKILYLVYTLGLPMLLTGFSWWSILIGFAVMHYICGFILAIIFQPAHVMENCSYASDQEGEIDESWASYQLLTTTNFAPKSRLFSWYVGGLNFQIEHHLFPNICHVHYKKLSKIVKQTAKEFGLPYHSQRTFMHALWVHGRTLYELGKKEPNLQSIAI